MGKRRRQHGQAVFDIGQTDFASSEPVPPAVLPPLFDATGEGALGGFDGPLGLNGIGPQSSRITNPRPSLPAFLDVCLEEPENFLDVDAADVEDLLTSWGDLA